jgi:inosose dehydratase
MTLIPRRSLLKAGAIFAAIPAMTNASFTAAATSAIEESDPWMGLKMGVASYSLRELPIEQAIEGIKRVGLKYVSIKNVKNHIDITHSTEERKQRAQMFRDAGITPLSVGNVTMRSGEEEARKAFEFARDIGVPTIVCAPDHDSLPMLSTIMVPKTSFSRRHSMLCEPLRNSISGLGYALMSAILRAPEPTLLTQSSSARNDSTMCI